MAIPAIAPGDSLEGEDDGEGSVTIIAVGEAVFLEVSVGYEVEVGGIVEEDEDEVASTGKFSPGLNCIEEFFANAN